METGRLYGAFWIRGLWAFLMIIVINLVIGIIGAGVSFLLKPVFPRPFMYAYLLVLPTVGLPFIGWLFEQLASRIPRVSGPR